MSRFIIALAQINTTVGALETNADKMIRYAKEAARDDASLVVFPELALSGYPPEDLVLKDHFLEDCERQLQRLEQTLPPDAMILIGCPIPGPDKAYNACQVFHQGKRTAVYHKVELPNYGVFDEQRLFEAGDKPLVVPLGDLHIGIHICEDSWNPNGMPITVLQEKPLDLLINLSASPYHKDKLSLREAILRHVASTLRTSVAYCNLVSGQDELVFDGASMALGPTGDLICRGPQFAEAVVYCTLSLPPDPSGKGNDPFPEGSGEGIGVHPKPLNRPINASVSVPFHANRITPLLAQQEEVYFALKLGLKDYADKNRFDKTVIAISGGIDSALVATLAVDALGPERVTGISMPSEYSSEGTRTDAEQLAQNLSINFHILPIQSFFEGYLNELSSLWPGRPADTTEENLQARIRGTIIMALSNKFGWLVLTTGNKSELATGYCTLYGDMAGGFAVIKDVPKTLVFTLAQWRNQQGAHPIIPPSTIERPPSAELRSDQKDSDSLPPYDLLDAVIERYVERDMGIDAIVTEGYDPGMVAQIARLIDVNEYKRRQAPPGIKITPKAFGRDRRMPITNRYRE